VLQRETQDYLFVGKNRFKNKMPLSKGLNTAFSVFNHKKPLVFSVALCDLCGEKGLVSGFPNTIVFALLPYAGGTPARAHVCGTLRTSAVKMI